MEVSLQLAKFVEFFEQSYLAEILENSRKGKNFVVIDFSKLLKFDHELAEELLEQPEETLKAMELAIEQFDLPQKTSFRVRITNLPSSQNMMIRDIRSKHLGKLYFFSGIVRQKSDVRPQVTTARFECPSCGNVINVIQLDSKFKEPSSCSCGRKGKFRMLSKELIDAQGLVLEEATDDLEGGEQPKRMNVLLKDDLVSPLSEKRTNPGAKIGVIGIVKEVPITTKSGAQATRYDLIIEANYIVALEENFYDIEISKEEEEKIKAIAQDPKGYSRLIKSVAPSIYGYDAIKEALILQLVGGVRKKRTDGVVTRGDIHILLVGDPGAAKSQLLKRASKIAPKGRFVSGKGVSGAGLIAAVVKDEFLKGWALEAGALVLANHGLCSIDEIDKMSDEDRNAMHEAMEGQSYHPSTELLLADGSTIEMGKFVDNLMEKNKSKITKGTNCEFLFLSNKDLATTDFEKIYLTKIKRISRHPSPEFLVEITFSNGSRIKVTPEHPLFILSENGDYKEVPACLAKEGVFVPVPRKYVTNKQKIELKKGHITHRNNSPVFFPQTLSKDLAKLLGYLITEGHFYRSKKNRYAELGVSNTTKRIINDASNLFKKIFKANVLISSQKPEKRKNATKELFTARCSSIPLYNFFNENFPEMMAKAPQKRIPQAVKAAPLEIQQQFLQSAFSGDGFIDKSGFGYCTSSFLMAKDYQNILLQHGILNYVREEKRGKSNYFKVYISETASMDKFQKRILPDFDHRKERITSIISKSNSKLNYRDPVPTFFIKQLKYVLNQLKIDDGYFGTLIKNNQSSNRKVVQRYISKIEDKIKDCESILSSNDARRIRKSFAIEISQVAKQLSFSPSMITYLERKKSSGYENLLNSIRKMALEKIIILKEQIKPIKKFINSDIRLVSIKKVDLIKSDCSYVYDVTVNPNQSFVSEGLILHNTATIAKANIQATLRCETTILAAANPKLGRFDPYDIIAKQIDLPPTLINRFDLLFPIKDVPSRETDEKLASHVLGLHQNPDAGEPEIETNLLKKFIAYARQNCFPKLTDEALKEIKEFYVGMRNKDQSEGEIRTIPITARQLEALVRMAEARAKLRLSDKVTKQDARHAIRLLQTCLQQVGVDPETGKIDIDRITTGISTSQRSKIFTIKEIIVELENKIGKIIPLEDVLAAAKEKGIDEAEFEEIIERLKRSGDIFEPRRNFISRI